MCVLRAAPFAEVPGEPVVEDASGRALAGVAGPFRAGESTVLTCSVRGGKYASLPLARMVGPPRNKRKQR